MVRPVRLSTVCLSSSAASSYPGLRIRFHAIWIRIQHFRLKTDPDPDPEFRRPKVKQNLQLKKNLIFWGIKTTIYLSQGLHKGRPSYKKSLQLSKENIQHLKT